MWNLIISGRVVEQFQDKPVFHPDLLLLEGNAELGDDCDGENFSQHTEPLPDEPSRIASIKSAAGGIILARYPQWKQSNMIARMVELVDKKLTSPLTLPEQIEEQALRAAWSWVKSVRAASNAAEATADLSPQQIIWPE